MTSIFFLILFNKYKAWKFNIGEGLPLISCGNGPLLKRNSHSIYTMKKQFSKNYDEREKKSTKVGQILKRRKQGNALGETTVELKFAPGLKMMRLAM